MKRTSHSLLLAMFAAATLLQSAHAQSAKEPAPQAETSPPAQQEALYSEGTKAMDEQRWSDAVTAFDRVAAAKGHLSDASLYWKAYSLNKLGKTDEARATCDSLSKQQPTSPWNRECLALQARSMMDVTVLAQMAQQTEQQTAQMAQQKAQMEIEMSRLNSELSPLTVQGDGKLYFGQRQGVSEDDIKILALNSLMRQDPAKAVPLLQDFLKSDKPISIRKQALFVLSRSKDPQVQALLAEVATTKSDPELQSAAVATLSLSRGKDANATLVEVYRASTDAAVKRAAINGLFLTHDAPRLVDLARGEKDLNLKRDIVSQLSLMNDKAATDYMIELLK